MLPRPVPMGVRLVHFGTAFSALDPSRIPPSRATRVGGSISMHRQAPGIHAPWITGELRILRMRSGRIEGRYGLSDLSRIESDEVEKGALGRCMSKPAATAEQPSIPWSPQLFEEITDLLAEALYQDFQPISKSTVYSPQGTEHTKSLTKSSSYIR